MDRMTVTIDPELVDQVREVLGASTKAEAIRMALREVLRRQRLAKALEHRGRISLDLDQPTLQRLREEPSRRRATPGGGVRSGSSR
jgi:Arc/MetJ family transcription regulator